MNLIVKDIPLAVQSCGRWEGLLHFVIIGYMADGEKFVQPPTGGAGALKYDLDLVSGNLTWSNELYTVFGYYDTGINTKYDLEWWTSHIHHDDAMTLNRAMDRLLYPWVSEWTVSYRLQKADNSYVPVHDRAEIIRNGEGKAIRLRGTIWIDS